MLYIKFGTLDADEETSLSYINSPDGIFDSFYSDNWIINNEFAERIVRNIDQCEIIDTNLIKSKKLGLISTDWLASGTKNLIIAQQNDGIVIDGDKLGDNCWPYLLELSLVKDVQMTLYYFPIFEWIDGAIVEDIVTGKVASSFDEFSTMHRHAADKYSHFLLDDVQWPVPLDSDIFKVNWEDFD